MSDYVDKHKASGDYIAALIKTRCFAPHCDARVLHAPGQCWSCDGYPDWQLARKTWGINFTGQNNPELLPCPATLKRAVETINLWPGNRPAIVEIESDK